MAWYVKRDGMDVCGPLPDKDAAWVWLQKNQGMSVDWATRHEGYAIEARPGAVVLADKQATDLVPGDVIAQQHTGTDGTQYYNHLRVDTVDIRPDGRVRMWAGLALTRDPDELVTVTTVESTE